MMLARNSGPGARTGSPAEVVRDAEVVLLAVHWTKLDDVLGQAGSLAGKVVLTCMMPLNDENTDICIPNTTSGAEVLVLLTPDASVVSTFNTVLSEALFGLFESRPHSPCPSLVHCGDDGRRKIIAAELISDVGFDPVDAGSPRTARYTEPFAIFGAQLSHSGSNGPELTNRFDWL